MGTAFGTLQNDVCAYGNFLERDCGRQRFVAQTALFANRTVYKIICLLVAVRNVVDPDHSFTPPVIIFIYRDMM